MNKMYNDLFSIETKITKEHSIVNIFDKLIYYLCIIDILFLPYIRSLHASISMLLLPLWALYNLNKIKLNKEFKLFMLWFFFTMISILTSTINFSQYINSNIISFVIIFYGFLYYLFFSFYFKNTNTSLNNILILYITFGLILSIIYYMDASLYFRIRAIWTMSGNIIEVNSPLSIHRFTSTFSDPNNTAIAFIAVLNFLIYNSRINLIQATYVLLSVGFIIFSTMSSTGLILFCGTSVFLIIRLVRIIIYNLKNNCRVRIRTILFISILILALPILYFPITNFLNSNVVQLALTRFSDNTITSRTNLWGNLLKYKNIFYFIFYGYGGTIVVNNSPYKPHNGHLHLIYNYGMIVYVIFVYIFFRVRKDRPLRNYIFLIPIFIGFTINVGIYEPRFMNLLALLVAYYANTSFENKEKYR